MTVINPNSISGITSITLPAGADNVLTIHTNDGTERFRIDSSGNVKVGSACTISQDGDVFFTGVCTATTLAGSGANLTALPAANLTGTLPAISGANLTGIAATDNVRTGILDVAGISTFRNTMNVGAAVTISESGIEASGIGITVANINGAPISGRRNIIINGDHRIAQRGTAAVTATTSAGYKCVDRWKTDIDGSGGGDFSHAQSTDVPTGQGFTHSSKVTVVTQASQPSGTSNRHQFYTQLEKQDVVHLEWGTSAAKTCTLSFWVKSSVAGTYILWFRHYGGTTHSYYTNYTINSADTWEKKVITLTGYTSGGNVSGTTDSGFLVEWNLGTSSGSETGTLNEWTTSGDIRAAAGSVYLPENSGATWYITGCQFEVGSQATDFEFRKISEELALCQRYYYVHLDSGNSGKSFMNSTQYNSNASYGHLQFACTMRTSPTLEIESGTNYYGVFGNATAQYINDLSTVSTSPNGAELGGSTSMGQGNSIWWRAHNASSKIAFTAEL